MFSAMRLEFAFNFHKTLIAKVAETAATNMDKMDEWNMFAPIIQTVGQSLKKIDFELDFKSSRDIPAHLQTFFRKNMKGGMQLKKMMVPDVPESDHFILDQIALFTAIKGEVHIGFALEDMAAVEIEVLDENALKLWVELCKDKKQLEDYYSSVDY